ncbi:MAG: sporulation integral membrane protein YlbJ, partial [Lachnospiraceae bacterium]|nr:sporulation integral membrane protein YlbJ [Lachnospiraceae bacterium]
MLFFQRKIWLQPKIGLSLFANSVVPALLPFFIAAELLSHTNIIPILGKYLNKLMKPLFNVPGIGSFAFLMGIISGYPVGAKIVSDFRTKGLCTKEEGERLLAFTNNSGPLFIIGTVGIAMFGDSRTGFLLFLTHILSCITVGIIFRFWKKDKLRRDYRNTIEDASIDLKFSSLGELLANSISHSIATILNIGGFIVLFSVVISILTKLNLFGVLGSIFANIFSTNSELLSGFFSGLIELTNGVQNISGLMGKSISINIILCAFLLGFGGISVLLQVFSIISKTDVSIKPYFIGKLLQGSFSAFYTYLFLKYTNLFNLDIVTTFS